jgi:basic membrane protein A
MEGISVSTLADLDEFIKMGQAAEKYVGKKVLPMDPEQIRNKVKAMRDAVPQWIWQAVSELEAQIREGKAQVPLPLTESDVKTWRETLG